MIGLDDLTILNKTLDTPKTYIARSISNFECLSFIIKEFYKPK